MTGRGGGLVGVSGSGSAWSTSVGAIGAGWGLYRNQTRG